MKPAIEPATGTPAAGSVNGALVPMPSATANQVKSHKRRPLLFVGLAFVALALGTTAVWFYYRSARNQAEVLIYFHDAHGLRNGADVRHRGLIVGRVSDVRIRPESEGVEVRVKLQPEADQLGRAGSHFYIVRPTVSLNNGIRGLDAAIGDVYVEVVRPPSQSGERQTTFEGSEEPPMPSVVAGSRQFVLLSKRRTHALRPGAQVTCAGFEIGQVQSVELLDNGRTVRSVFSIFPKHIGLIDEKSRFVESNPVIFEGSFPGTFKLKTDVTALTGGIEMIPPDRPEKEASEGHAFKMSN